MIECDQPESWTTAMGGKYIPPCLERATIFFQEFSVRSGEDEYRAYCAHHAKRPFYEGTVRVTQNEYLAGIVTEA